MLGTITTVGVVGVGFMFYQVSSITQELRRYVERNAGDLFRHRANVVEMENKAREEIIVNQDRARRNALAAREDVMNLRKEFRAELKGSLSENETTRDYGKYKISHLNQ